MPAHGQIRELLAEGDTSAAATVALRAVGPEMLGYLRATLRDEGDARDAFSAFAESLWKALPAFRFEASLRTWAFRLAWSAALDVRSEAWRRRVRRLETGELSAVAEEVRTVTAVRVEQQRQVLDRLREGLSPEELSLLVLRVDKGLSWEEVAAIMEAGGAPAEPATLAKRFERLKRKLAAEARRLGLVE